VAPPVVALDAPEPEALPVALRAVRVTPWVTGDSPEAASPGTGVACSATPPTPAALAGPLPTAGPGCPSPGNELDVDEGPVATGLSSSCSEIREMATLLASNTTRADAKASHTCALVSLPFATE
jgi:hypothetical protein